MFANNGEGHQGAKKDDRQDADGDHHNRLHIKHHLSTNIYRINSQSQLIHLHNYRAQFNN